MPAGGEKAGSEEAGPSEEEGEKAKPIPESIVPPIASPLAVIVSEIAFLTTVFPNPPNDDPKLPLTKGAPNVLD